MDPGNVMFSCLAGGVPSAEPAWRHEGMSAQRTAAGYKLRPGCKAQTPAARHTAGLFQAHICTGDFAGFFSVCMHCTVT